ncbi:MAG TPA: hypothetical protein VGM82_18920 [Gemmatimonadaceae bacterium]|jgi:hypothetical protein
MTFDLSNPASVVAEATRRQQLRDAGADTFAEGSSSEAGARIIDDAERGRLEKEIEHACDKLVLAIGGRVVRFSHPGKTKQTPGIADRLYCFPTLRLATWFECKTPEGKQRPDQKLFEEDVVRCGHEYTLGGLGDFKAWLVARGVVTGFDAGGHPITRSAA